MARGAHLKYEIKLPSDKLSQNQRHTFEDYQMKWPFPHISHLQKLKSSSRGTAHTLSKLVEMAAFPDVVRNQSEIGCVLALSFFYSMSYKSLQNLQI